MNRIFLLLFFGLFTASSLQAEELLPLRLASRPSLTEIYRFRGADKDHLVYELYLENFETRVLRLEALQIEVKKGGKNVFVKEIRGPELAQSFTLLPENYLKAQDPVLPPGAGAILFVFVDLPPTVGSAGSISNQLVLEAQGQPQTRMTLKAGEVVVSPKPGRVVAAPLKGKYWWTYNAPANNSIHRRVVVPIDGAIWVPERFASDWIRLDENGKNYQGPKDQNSSYHAYGQKLYAVAAGKVTAVKDGITENVPNSGKMAAPITLETIGGNYVILDIGGGLYAFYAHLQPGKIAVKVGDVVKLGEPIGILGNSGNSTEPHLHFHIIDHPDPLRGQGQPYLFDRFYRLGTVTQNKEEDPIGLTLTGKTEAKNQAYMNLELVEFE